MSHDTLTVIQPGDLDPTYFIIDPQTRKIKIAVNAFVAVAAVSGDTATMFADGASVIPADPTSPSYIYAGMALNSAQVGQIVYTRVVGVWRASHWSWEPNLPVFVGLNGALTQAPPMSPMIYSHCIGRAVDATTLQLLPDALVRIGD